MSYDPLLQQPSRGASKAYVDSKVAGGGGPPAGPAGGDLAGTYPNPAVVRIAGNPLGTTTPVAGNLLVGDGTDWETRPVAGDASLAASGALTLAATGVIVGAYGDSTHVGAFTVDAKGRIVAAASVPISGTIGASGPPGMDGEDGEMGMPGLPGVAGAAGATGATGATGAPGAVGAIGVAGPIGPTGFDGIDGEDGLPGVMGAVGPTGATGTAGAAGATGSPGADGVAGVPGLSGADGIDGEDGFPGLPGVAGPAGAAGATGAAGAAGSQGVAGAIGPMGVPGEDGEDGLPGLPGVVGVAGATGATGAAGAVGAIGAQGLMGFPGFDGLDGEDSFVPGPRGLQGLNGLQGSPGFDGEAAEEGFTPFEISSLTSISLRRHSDLQSLLVDDHTIYALLAGRAGGQTLIGGTASGEDVTLKATAHATKGDVILDDAVQLWPSMGNFPVGTGTTRAAIRVDGTWTQSPSGVSHNWKGLSCLPSITANAVGFADFSTIRFIDVSPTVIAGNNAQIAVVYAGGTYTQTVAPFFNYFRLFDSETTLQSATANVAPPVATIFNNNTNFKYNVASGTAALSGAYGFTDGPAFQNVQAGGTFTIAALTSFLSWPSLIETAGTLTITDRRGFWHHVAAFTNSPAITTDTAIDIDDTFITGVTTALSLRSVGTGVQMRHAGNVRLGDSATAPTALLDLIGKLTMSSAGLVTKYNNIVTVSNGVPAELATVDTTGLTANVAAALLYAVPSTGVGMYRVSALIVETTAASISSTLPNLQVVYTDAQTSGVITIDVTPVLGVAGTGQTGALTANTVGTTVTGVIAINAKASTNINYQTVNYASSLAGMAYALHIKLEAL